MKNEDMIAQKLANKVIKITANDLHQIERLSWMVCHWKHDL